MTKQCDTCIFAVSNNDKSKWMLCKRKKKSVYVERGHSCKKLY